MAHSLLETGVGWRIAEHLSPNRGLAESRSRRIAVSPNRSPAGLGEAGKGRVRALRWGFDPIVRPPS